ncbi:relaxase MobL [Stecheria sp. CLA-KB-P133]|uniref:Relaxase MobL n=1 Tax=Grylomicrobium aquisgranensis TaxID=2926318 RepID=A0AB35U4F4_9FIRM|nr:relaxase MobL [Stecheria sp. CLA-KB-P133]
MNFDESIPGQEQKDQKNNENNGSFVGYTSRGHATEHSSNQGKYFTMTNDGKIYTEEERKAWIERSMASFSKPGDLAWTVVVSLDNYDLLKDYGLNDQNDFARLTQQCLYKSFKEMHLDPSNMIWWEDYHTNTKHPHMHITFLEKEHRRDRGKFTGKEIGALKRVFISQISARKKYMEMYGRNADDDLQRITPLRQGVVKRAETLDYKTIESIASLYTQLPEKGRLQYNSSMMIPFRKQLASIVDEILNTESVRADYEEFVSNLQRLDQVLNDAGNEKISHMFDAEDHKLRVQIANDVLQEYKNSKEIFQTLKAKQDAWKTSHGSDIADVVLKETDESVLTAPQKAVVEALQHSELNHAEKLSDQLGNTGFDEFLKGVCCLMSEDDSIRNNGVHHLHNAEKKGVKQARHIRNYQRMSFGIPKRMYHTMQVRISPSLLHSAHRSINAETRDVHDQLSAFAHNQTRIVYSERKEQGAEEIAEQTENVIKRENGNGTQV